ncbi:MAG: beta-galactosidase trimerization domain-containing protein, partial [Candidatus Zipacnadales bacterium]
PITMRYARRLGLDCLGVTGKFHTSWGDFSSFKHREALEYECFTQIANGAKCSIGDQLHPTGELCPETYRLIGEVYARVEALEPWLMYAEPQAEIAVFNPEALGKADGRVDSSAAGAYRMLVESHHQFDYVDNESELSRYSVLVLPDKIRLDDELAAKVKVFLDRGGALLLSHKSGRDEGGTRFMLDEIGVRYLGEAPYSPDFVLAGRALQAGTPSVPHVMYERGLEVRLEEGTECLAETYDPYFNRTYDHFCSHQHAPLKARAERPAVTQAGNVVYLAHPVFRMYQRWGARFWKQLTMNALALLLRQPLVRTNAPTTAQVTVTYQETEHRTMLHILHYIPERRAQQLDTIQDLIPLHEVKVALRCAAAPAKVYLAPEETELNCTWIDGYAEVTVPCVEGYAVVVIQQ